MHWHSDVCTDLFCYLITIKISLAQDLDCSTLYPSFFLAHRADTNVRIDQPFHITMLTHPFRNTQTSFESATSISHVLLVMQLSIQRIPFSRIHVWNIRFWKSLVFLSFDNREETRFNAKTSSTMSQCLSSIMNSLLLQQSWGQASSQVLGMDFPHALAFEAEAGLDLLASNDGLKYASKTSKYMGLFNNVIFKEWFKSSSNRGAEPLDQELLQEFPNVNPCAKKSAAEVKQQGSRHMLVKRLKYAFHSSDSLAK